MADGGWNCRAMPSYGGATHGSFHTTISALEGLLEYDRFRGGSVARAASARGREFLLGALQNRYPGKTFFEMEAPGDPSR